ncbi:nicotinate-nucleotide pyrophosphorylase (carboxylating) [Halomonas campaniensis]|uniref:Probable nicotinate-nucleotide pyrophosphorylase [carboxylating] n=1 Tax=Halomonas campaniensis TaxID=213554 RepID=A0A7W5K4B4_9GAMM|nr:carboxylating nicotinate-nucleotide diphosphorylase [Halomonas campaniensis]MBB3331711.1 nicotinate-nucleotide pyrophosphorylase (carboxylating) [Halomonas campaniensis]
MYQLDRNNLCADMRRNVAAALMEDVGDGDVTAKLVPFDCIGEAVITAKETAIVCGAGWVDEVFYQIDPEVRVFWSVKDGDEVEVGQGICQITGRARSLLAGERTALNYLQTLSGTATRSWSYCKLIEGTSVKLLDTRKTLPGMRLAQKYAVRCGGCHSHRMGLYDAYLIKENHIAACGGIALAINEARRLAPEKSIEVEVEDIEEFHQALEASPDIIMLDNFGVEDMCTAVRLAAGRVVLEASGGITEATLIDIARTGVDYISLGTLTKDLEAIDLSMRLSI